MVEHEEVVIDGDSTDEEEEVRVISVHARNRRRRSNIMMDQDDEEEEDEEEKTDDQAIDKENEAVASFSAPRRQKIIQLDETSISAQKMTLRTPTPVRRSHRKLQQLSIAAAVARGDHGRCHEHENVKRNDNDDDICIIQTPCTGTKSNSGHNNRRLVIENSDEERGGDAEMEQGRHKNADRRDKNDEATLSASRQSARIQHKLQEKGLQHGIARKLSYPVLDNCLKHTGSLGPHYQDEDSSEYSDDDLESEPEGAVEMPPRKRQRLLVREGERSDREKLYADAGEDVDGFICDDDEIEYMEDDEEGAISVESPDDVMEDNLEEVTAILAAGRSREISEWFKVYLEYLEECIVDPDFENKMRRKRSKAKHHLYDQAVNRIERKICSCRDAVRSGVAWPEEMVDALKCASLVRSSHVPAEQNCEACNRRQHVATYHVEFFGVVCDATKLYGHNWMHHLKKTIQEAIPVQVAFEMGSICYARTLAFWQLLHAKQFWCILVDAKLKECADSTGRIAEQFRNDFFTKEFGRYKKLVGLVEKFAEDSKRLTVCMPNVWERITPRNVTSDFLPQLSRPSLSASAESRRGTLDAFVTETEEEEDTEDEEAEMEKKEEKQRAVVGASDVNDQFIDDKEEMKEDLLLGSVLSKQEDEQKFQVATNGDDEKGDYLVKDEKNVDDLMCLVCDASQRDAGVVHGLYLHVYCCYACAKKQFRTKSGCMVCNRLIDRVLRLLPLTLDARNAIRKETQS